ncbi:hypothetical protein RJT34_16509 [Clitoria ternatea]|uniref:50S ribosomal protein L33, chloroplastic n=1 Tax=Clitoria ternatea TaxID=43366 RepID=A0AAN9J796_CLITE
MAVSAPRELCKRRGEESETLYLDIGQKVAVQDNEAWGGVICGKGEERETITDSQIQALSEEQHFQTLKLEFREFWDSLMELKEMFQARKIDELKWVLDDDLEIDELWFDKNQGVKDNTWKRSEAEVIRYNVHDHGLPSWINGACLQIIATALWTRNDRETKCSSARSELESQKDPNINCTGNSSTETTHQQGATDNGVVKAMSNTVTATSSIHENRETKPKGVKKVINIVSVTGPKEGDTPGKAKYSQVNYHVCIKCSGTPGHEAIANAETNAAILTVRAGARDPSAIPSMCHVSAAFQYPAVKVGIQGAEEFGDFEEWFNYTCLEQHLKHVPSSLECNIRVAVVAQGFLSTRHCLSQISNAAHLLKPMLYLFLWIVTISGLSLCKDWKKKAQMFLRLVSVAGTGFFYVKRKPRQFTEKLEFRKYDPTVN